MDLEQIKEIMAQVEASKLKKFSLKKGDFELQLEKEGEAPVTAAPYSSSYPPPRAPAPEQAPAPPPESAFHPESKATAKSRTQDPDAKYVVSPMVGTFYASPGPGQPPFVKVGDSIEANTVVCIIEAMKVMNEVKAGVSGTVAEVLIEHAHPVEFSTKIFRIV